MPKQLSEKYVLGLYLDGLVDAVCGTHTHVQTNDAHTLPNGTCFISDAGMTGPYNSAIGANFWRSLSPYALWRKNFVCNIK